MDAWGKILSVTDGSGNTVSDASHIANVNPIRYRGYYYDVETGFYYLQSRYYDPEVGRFINADGVMGANNDMATYNLFVYCGNNPVVRYDDSGLLWKELISGVLHAANNFLVAIGVDTAAVGSFFLMMEQDSGGVYHARQDCWQQYAGYNSLYDFVFDLATSMKATRFPFSCDGVQYMIWAWKGDYINLGAGAELGIYVGSGPHYFVDTNQAMSMCMGVLYKGENIIWYAPDEKQWWITGFNPVYRNVNEGDITAFFGINFNSQSMYNAFYAMYKYDPRICAFISSERGVVIRL